MVFFTLKNPCRNRNSSISTCQSLSVALETCVTREARVCTAHLATIPVSTAESALSKKFSINRTGNNCSNFFSDILLFNELKSTEIFESSVKQVQFSLVLLMQISDKFDYCHFF